MKTAVLNQDVPGRFSTWTKGTRIKVSAEKKGRCTIECIDDKAQGLTLTDVMCDVPLEFVTIDEHQPYGFDVEIELNGNEFIEKHFTGTEAAVRRKCMMVKRAKRVVSMKPLTRKQWVGCYGDPTVRNAFS